MIFKLYGLPVAKQSTRFKTVKNKLGKDFNIQYTQKNIKDYANNMQYQILSQLPEDYKIIDEPIEVNFIFHFPYNKTLSKEDKQNKNLGYSKYKDTKPDFDNLAKSICDIMNGIVFKDDNQIVRAVIEKFYSEKSGVVIEILEPENMWNKFIGEYEL